MILWLLLAVAAAANIEGSVLERGSGDPIEGVTVSDGEVSATTHADGIFSIESSAEPVTLTFQSPSHQPASVELSSLSSKRVVIFLSASPAPLEIVVESFKRTAHISRQPIDAEMAYETPGTFDDSVRLVQSLPSVTVQREYAPGSGDLSVRGSLPGDNRYFIDGVEIPYLYHFNQYASVLPASQLDQLQLYSSTFGAAYGDAVGAVIEADSKLDKPLSTSGDASLNFVMMGGSLSAPVNKKWWLSASGRRSYQDLYTEGTAQYTLWPSFHDYTLRATRQNGHNKTSLFLWGANDSYTRAISELDVLNPVEQINTPTLAYNRGFIAAGALHDWGDPAHSGHLVAAVVNDHTKGELSTQLGEQLTSRYLTSRARQEIILDSASIEFGADLKAEQTSLTTDDVGDAALDISSELPALARGTAIDDSAYRLKGGAYAQTTLGSALMVIPGVRLSYDTLSETPVTADPRVASHLSVGEQTLFKVAVGRYQQAPRTDVAITESGPLPNTTSWQVAGGVEQTIASRLEINLEAYQKWSHNVIYLPIIGPVEVVDSGRSTGIELTGRYRIRDLFFLWTWLSYSRSTLTDNDHSFPSDSDQPLAGGLVLSWDLSEAWNVGTRYQFGSGLPYTPVDGAVYEATHNTWHLVAGDPNSARYPAYHKVDLHIARQWIFNRWTLSTTAELWMVPKSAAQLYPVHNYDASETIWVMGPTLFPLLGARAKF